MSTKHLSLLLVGTGLLACSSLQRHPKSGYYDWNESSYSEYNPHDRKPVKEYSVRNRAPSSLEVLESKIDTESEWNEYQKYKPLLKEDDARRDFLQINSKYKKEKFLAAQGIDQGDIFTPEIQETINNSDLMVGMSRDAVIQSWGAAESIEVAGNPNYGNERWKYVEFEGSPDGYQKKERYVYFKRGRVTGWKTK